MSMASGMVRAYWRAPMAKGTSQSLEIVIVNEKSPLNFVFFQVRRRFRRGRWFRSRHLDVSQRRQVHASLLRTSSIRTNPQHTEDFAVIRFQGTFAADDKDNDGTFTCGTCGLEKKWTGCFYDEESTYEDVACGQEKHHSSIFVAPRQKNIWYAFSGHLFLRSKPKAQSPESAELI